MTRIFSIGDHLTFEIEPETSEYGGYFGISFKVYEIIGEDDEGVLYERKGATSSMDTVHELTEAEVFASGRLNWDGCMNINFVDQGYFHFCGLRHASKLNMIMDTLYAEAVKVMPEHKDHLSS